ncbi:MAG: hypothetical protein NTAFB01_36150 [Nitrospira sp.]
MGTCCCEPITTKQLTEPQEAWAVDGQSVETHIPTAPPRARTKDKSLHIIVP